jgi:hypothetical protein
MQMREKNWRAQASRSFCQALFAKLSANRPPVFWPSSLQNLSSLKLLPEATLICCKGSEHISLAKALLV